MSNQFERPSLPPQETKKHEEKNPEEQKQEFREAREKLEKNDILVGEMQADMARTLFYQAKIEFDWKILAGDEKVSSAGVRLPKEFIFRLDDPTDESADKAFAILKEAGLRCDIVKEVIDLDKERELNPNTNAETVSN